MKLDECAFEVRKYFDLMRDLGEAMRAFERSIDVWTNLMAELGRQRDKIISMLADAFDVPGNMR